MLTRLSQPSPRYPVKRRLVLEKRKRREETLIKGATGFDPRLRAQSGCGSESMSKALFTTRYQSDGICGPCPAKRPHCGFLAGLQIPSLTKIQTIHADGLYFWSGRRDLNPRPFGPEPNALPNCATPRKKGAKADLRPSFMEPNVRLELTTCALRMRCSTD